MGERYVFDLSAWEITEPDFEALAREFLPTERCEKALRFVFLDDRKRAFVSHMLQLKLARDAIRLERWIEKRISPSGDGSASSAGRGRTTTEHSHLIEAVRHYYAESTRPDEVERIIRKIKLDTYDAADGVVEGEAEEGPHQEIEISRTSWGKPFLRRPRLRHTNFNFNVSHEGRYVVGVSDHFGTVGVDVAAPKRWRKWRSPMAAPETAPPRSATGGTNNNELPAGTAAELEELRRDFKACLTRAEWDSVASVLSSEEESESLSGPATAQQVDTEHTRVYSAFMRIWSLKESFVKARGDGLGFELGNCEFALAVEEDGEPVLRSVLGEELPQRGASPDAWRFSQHALPSGHWVSVARGPFSCIQEDAETDVGEKSAKSRFVKRNFSAEDWNAVLDLPMPDFFTELTLDDLLQLSCSGY